jgi:hypothetical protein
VTLTIGIKRKQKRLNFLHLNFFLHLTCHVNRTSTLLLLILQQKLTSRGVTVFINYLLTEKNIPTKTESRVFNQGRIKRRFDELAALFCNFGKNELKICSSKMITDEKEY